MEMKIQDCTIGKVVAANAEKFGDKVFLEYLPDGRTFTYRDLDMISNRLANALMARGTAKDMHVAVMMENAPEQLFLYIALAKIGAVSVPINTAARGRQLGHLLELSDASALVTETGFLEGLNSEMLLGTGITQLIMVGGHTTAQEIFPASTGVSVTDFAELESGDGTQVEGNARFCDPAFLVYTSGTTGPSKLSIYPQAHCVGYALNNAEEHDYLETDVAYVCLPMFHVSALFGVTFAALLTGGSVVMTKHFSRSRFWDDIRSRGVTLINSLGAMSEFLWSSPPSPADRDHKVRLCRMVPVPRFAHDFEERFGVTIVSGYGLSDFGQVAAFTAKDPREKLGSPGKPRRGIEIRIVDDEDLDKPCGEVGEIVVRSNNPWNTAQGYYKMPEATVA